MRKLLLAAAVAVLQPWPTPSPATAHEATEVTGWWIARLTHGGESRDFYLHFAETDGALKGHFSIPEIGADKSSLGPANVTAATIEMPAVGWTLKRENGGRVLLGTIPASLVPHYELQARFVPAKAPPAVTNAVVPDGTPPVSKWRTSLREAIVGGLAFDQVSARVLAGTTAGKIVALSAADGSRAWEVDAGAAIRATPLVSEGSVYVPTDRALVKLDARTGRQLWSASFGTPKAKMLDPSDPESRWDMYSSSAVLAGHVVYVGSRDGCVHALRDQDGVKLRKFCSNDIITATPVVRDGRVYFGSFDGKVYAAAVDDGRALWSYDTHGPVTGDLVLVSDKVIAGSRSYDLTALDAGTGKRSWTRYIWFSWIESSPAVAGHILYVGSSDSRRVFALDWRSGQQLWASRLSGWSWPKPALGRNTIYAGVVGTGREYVGKRAGGLAALDSKTGRLRWFIADHEGPAEATFYGFASAPLAADGHLYAASLSGDVFAFRDD